ncbi:MAG: formate dehydrogenase subunit gamma [Betaproteobacteria bacterium]|nr:formate dehydrogenase subunit gamma [Betaproteobacteria bacterium]MDE2208719.1 formate dehydrogenase subunit gamma [Betaproteobacteria bacterium]
MREPIVRAVTAIFAALLIIGSGPGFAQSPAVNPAIAEAAKAEQKQQVEQPLNNQPVWSEVRSGVPQWTSTLGRETNVLIQPQGETWRALRDGWVSVWAGWALVVMLVAIGAFYFSRGTLQLHEPLTGRNLRRFTAWERAIHWASAISFSILAISGLVIVFGKNLLLPLIGYTLFSWLAILAKNLHNFVGPLFIVCVVLLFFTFVRDNLWRMHDFTWIRHFGGLFSARDVPSGRFNAGEKLWFWGGLLVCGVVVGASGLILDFPNFNQTRGTMQIANIVHLSIASLFMLAGLGHIYMGTIGMAGAYDAMRTGYVDEAWAKEHHEYWYNDIKAGKIPEALEGMPDASPDLKQHPA